MKETFQTYLPQGEVYISQRNSSFDSRYKFSAKACPTYWRKLDDATNFNYFGARYLDSDLSIFISVDRFVAKYPHLSPYQYVFYNPTNHIDINGDTVYIYFVTGGLGHTAIGVKLPADKHITYANAYGEAHYETEYIPNRDGSGGATESITLSEEKTIEDYINGGMTVYRYAIVLPYGVEENIKGLAEGNMTSGDYCTDKIKELIREAYKMFGYSDEAAKQRKNDIVPMNIPRKYTVNEAKEAGIILVDIFSPGQNGDMLQNRYHVWDSSKGHKAQNRSRTDNVPMFE